MLGVNECLLSEFTFPPHQLPQVFQLSWFVARPHNFGAIFNFFVYGKYLGNTFKYKLDIDSLGPTLVRRGAFHSYFDYLVVSVVKVVGLDKDCVFPC